jgi:hypothetical protein
VLRGNPWASEPSWTTERVDFNVDSTTVQFLRTEHDGSSVLWVRTVERGFFLQRDEGPWERLSVEMPTVHPRCRLRTNPCGFGEPAVRSRHSAARGGLVYAVADNCPTLLVFNLDGACTSSLDLLEDGQALPSPAGLAIDEDQVYLLLPDGVVRAALLK